MPKKSTNKREIGNTSINSNSGIDDNMKKHKMDEEVSNEEISIMILDGGSVYFNKPAQLKVDFDRLNVSRVIKETKITVGKHLIITFNNEEGRELFLSKRNNFKKDIQIIDLKKKTKYEIVLKGLNFTAIDGYKFLLSKMGIIKISQMNKANENFRMVKAECEN